MKKTLVFAAFLVIASTLALSANAADEGTVVTAKIGAHALLIWDCTPLLASMVRDKQPSTTALWTLEAKAVNIARDRLTYLGEARTLTVRVLYEKTGAVNPQYGTPTFAGSERVFELTADAQAIKASSAFLAKQLGKGSTPKGVTVVMTGKLPPM